MYSHNNNYPVNELPWRITLPNGMTKTNSSTFTEEDIEYAGYRYVDGPPEYDILRQRVEWVIGDDNIASWKIVQIPDEEKWKEIRNLRNIKIKEFEWRISRYHREVMLEINITDIYIEDMHRYMQALADITKQEDPFNITWPQYNPT